MKMRVWYEDAFNRRVVVFMGEVTTIYATIISIHFDDGVAEIKLAFSPFGYIVSQIHGTVNIDKKPG